MPRPLRIHVPGAFYHVTLRGNHRQDIFFTPADRALFVELGTEALARFGARLHAYCLMTNHVHLLVQVAKEPLARVMHRVAGRYARRAQECLQTTGHLFEKRYHSVLVDADRYLLAVLRYIHLNPVRAGIVSDVADYWWSSHHAYVGTREETWLTTELVLSMFNRRKGPARAAYANFMSGQGDDTAVSPFNECNPNDTRVLGDDAFLTQLGLLPGTEEPLSRQSLSHIICEACTKFSLSPQLLRSESRRRDLARARAWIAHRAVSLGIASMTEVARSFNRSEATLRKSVKLYFEGR